MAVTGEIPVEREVFGVTYERYALQRFCARLVKKLHLRSVLEMPAGGAKAMPSLYSLGFALAGCRVALVDADAAAVENWGQLGLMDRLTLHTQAEVIEKGSAAERWDLAWNFAVLPLAEDPPGLLRRMSDLGRWILVVNVNRFNVGFQLHRTVHRIYKIPWTHGDIRCFSPFRMRDLMKSAGFQEIHWGVLDCPPWPDSPGFRDLRLHRQGEKLRCWESPYVEHLREGKFPAWLKLVHWGERVPLPRVAKLPYSHLYYAYGRVRHEAAQQSSSPD